WATIEDSVKFEDRDADGAPREPGEPGLPGWTIYVDYDGDGELGPDEPSDVTGPDGSYRIDQIKPGTWDVREVPQAEWTNSYPALGYHERTFVSRGTETGLDFGNFLFTPISGVVFTDVNGDIQQANFEVGISGVTVELLDENMGVVDTTTTNAIGSFLFRVAPGDYLINVNETTIPVGFELTTGNQRSPVTLVSNEPIEADFGYQEVVQFVTPLSFFRPGEDIPTNPETGEPMVFPFVRPADDKIGDMLRDPDRKLQDLLSSVASFQSFTVRNTTDSPLEITDITEVIQPVGISTDDFIRVFTEAQLNALSEMESELDSLFNSDPTAPIPDPLQMTISDQTKGITDPQLEIDPIPPNEEVSFFVFYRPINVVSETDDATGEQVDVIKQQLPDWFNDPETTTDDTVDYGAAHTFVRNDRLEVTASTGQVFQIQLVGGSTYDSDIFDFDGLTSTDDIQLVVAIVAGLWPTTPGDPPWDSTTDINTRFPNGAEQTVGFVWPDMLTDSEGVKREGALGDFGPVNVEVVRNSRAPFLDLDADNDSGAEGVDYMVEVSTEDLVGGSAVAIADTDVRFGNSLTADLIRLDVTILNPSAGDALRMDASSLPGGLSAAGNGTSTLVISGRGPVSDYLDSLTGITYSNPTPTSGARAITVAPTGFAGDFSFTTDNGTVDQTMGNVAIARVAVRPSGASTSADATSQSDGTSGPVSSSNGEGEVPAPAASDHLPTQSSYLKSAERTAPVNEPIAGDPMIYGGLETDRVEVIASIDRSVNLTSGGPKVDESASLLGGVLVPSALDGAAFRGDEPAFVLTTLDLLNREDVLFGPRIEASRPRTGTSISPSENSLSPAIPPGVLSKPCRVVERDDSDLIFSQIGEEGLDVVLDVVLEDILLP
ncbi:MAG: SdrD B-like domain-containing protein, partial [Rhodothermia bacterium]